MKSEWRVCTTPVDGKMLYGVYRLRDVSEIHHSGNMEMRGYYNEESDAEAEARRLNEKEGVGNGKVVTENV